MKTWRTDGRMDRKDEQYATHIFEVCACITCIVKSRLILKGTTTLMITMFHMKDLNKPWILIPVSSESVENCKSCGRLNICKWTVKEAAIL